MHIANITIGKDWIDLETAITNQTGTSFSFDSDKNYFIVNNGGYQVLLLNTTSAPTADNYDGLFLMPKEQCGLMLAQGKAYARSQNGPCNLHVEVED